MPIPRPISRACIDAQVEQGPGWESGVYRAQAPTNLDELEEVLDDEDDFTIPDLPSLIPSVHADSLMGPDLMPPSARAARPVPVFEMELDVPSAPVVRPHTLIRTSSTANMAAVRPPPVAPAPPPPASTGGGVSFESFEDEESLKLDIPLDIKAPPSSRQNVMTTLAGSEVAPPSEKATDPRPGIFAFAGYGLPPEKLGGTPAYALRVLARKWTLRDDLRIARMRRIQDVSLYEAALACADESAVTKGLALIAVSVVGSLGAVLAAAAFLL